MHRTLTVGAFALSALQQLSAQSPQPIRFELPNGLRVWVQEDHRRPIAFVQVTYKLGSINEGPGTTGTAHYIEHMVYRATENVRNEDIYGYIDRIGGRYTGGTGSLETTFGETVPNWAVESALRTTAERMGRAIFDCTEFDRERNNVVTEANGFSRTDPATAFHDAMMLTSFEVHPYRYTSNTWARDNLAITRDDAFNMYKRLYGPNNAVLEITGDVSTSDVRALVDKHFTALKRAPESGEVRVVEPPQRTEKRVVLTYAGDRKQIEIFYRAPQAASPDYPVLAVLDRVVSARLQRALAAAGAGDIATTHSATPYPFVYRLTATAPATADLDAIVRTIQSEIERLRAENIPADELAAARVDRAPQGRGGRGGRGANQAAGGAPRPATIQQIATQLGGREVFSWAVSADQREKIRVAQETVTQAQISAYVDRWLRTSQRTVGFLLPGKDDFNPLWSNGRPVVGERLEVPAMTVQPAKRMLPEPVPARAVEPLAKLPMQVSRRALTNGVVVRAARSDGATAALQLRIRLGTNADPPGKEGLTALIARLISSDSGLQRLTARAPTASLTNDGYFDVLVNVPAANVAPAVETVARALRITTFTAERIDAERSRPAQGGGGGRGGGGRNANAAAEARNRVLPSIAPRWRANDGSTPASLARITARDVNDALAQRLGGNAVIVSLVAPGDPAALLSAADKVFGTLRKGGLGASRIVLGTDIGGPPPTEERVVLASETQVAVLAGLPGVARSSPDYRALQLLNYIVGIPYYGGRLGWALTKTGLTYSSTATTTFGATTGHILFSTDCDTKNLESTIQAIREVVEGIAERGVTEWELREAQAFTLGRTLLNGTRDDSGDDAIAAALLDSEFTGEELLDLPAFSRGYLSVTLAQINDVAKRYYRPDLLKVVAVGAVPAGPKQQIFPAGTLKALFER
jgi:zinc protease